MHASSELAVQEGQGNVCCVQSLDSSSEFLDNLKHEDRKGQILSLGSYL